MIICGLDSSGDDILLGLAEGDRVLGSWQIPARRRHAELLPQEILRRLEDVGRTLDDVGSYAIVSGPGSFTGLRVGAATVMGLAAAKHIPVAALTSFEFLYHVYRDDIRTLGCVIPCRGELYYWSVFDRADDRGTPVRVLTLPEIARLVEPPIRIAEPNVRKLEDELAGQAGVELVGSFPPQAGGLLAVWGHKKIQAGDIIDWNNWHPNYGPAPGFRTWSAPRT